MKKLLLIFTILITMTLLAGCAQKEALSDAPIVPQEEPLKETAPIEIEPEPVAPVETYGDTTFYDPVPNTKRALIEKDTNSITVEFKNNVNQPIVLPLTGNWAPYSKTECKDYKITAMYKGKLVEPLKTEIQSGDTFTIEWNCNDPDKATEGSLFEANLAFNYQNTVTGMVRPQTGTITGKYS